MRSIRAIGVIACVGWMGFACTAVPAEGSDATRGPGRAAYNIAVRWDAKASTLSGVEGVAFTNTRPGEIRSVWLRLWANGEASCAQPLIVVHVLSGGTAAKSAARCTALQVRLPTALASGGRASIRIRIAIQVPRGTSSFARSKDGTALLGNALPLLAVTDAGGTHLEPYSTNGEASYSLASSWRVRLDVPRGLRVATTGTQVGSKLRKSHMRRVTFAASQERDFELAIGRLHLATTKAAGVRIRFFDTLPAGSATDQVRRHTLALAAADLSGFDQRFGPDGAKELDIVQVRALDGDGMEYPELVMVQMPPGADTADGLVTHEIAHQWFYRIVGDNQWAQPFLDESFATFAAQWPTHPCTAGDPLAGFPSSVRLTSNMAFFDSHPDGYYYRGLYGGGACALGDLRNGLGAHRFDDLLRSWVASHRYGVATIAEFVAAIRAVAQPGFDVDAYLHASRIDVH
jgi:Peptidase family M1 domain